MSTSSNKQIAKQVTDLIWNKGDIDSAVPYFHEDISYHGPRMTAEGKKNYVDLLKQYMGVLTETHFEMINMIEEGNTLACHGSLTGTHTGAYGEIPPTNKKLTVNLMSFIEIRDGKLYSETEIFDELGFLLEMGMEVVSKEHA